MEQLQVRWRISPYDLRHGVPRDVVPHLVVASVAAAWILAPRRGGTDAFVWLGVVVLGLQLVQVARVAARQVVHLRAAERILTVLDDAFVVTDTRGATVYDAGLVGVVDDRGILRLEFADGRVLEAPWRAFTHADLRRLRRFLRLEFGAQVDLHHVPVRMLGEVTGTMAWRRPVLALAVAAVLAALPWMVTAPA